MRLTSTLTLTLPFALVAFLSVAFLPMGAEGPTLADTKTRARSTEGTYISWHEHIIDDTASAGIAISGSDGLKQADLDQDGYPDFVSVHESDTTYDGAPEGHIRIAFSGKPGEWHNITLSQGAEAAAAEDVAIADVNGDGHLDVIAACELAHLIYFQNPGTNIRTITWPRLLIPITKDRGSYIRVFLADLNADGRPEAIAANKGAQSPAITTQAQHPVSIFSVTGDPLEASSWHETELGRMRIPQNSQPFDLDGDGDLDVVAGSRGERRILWFENQTKSGEPFAFVERRIELLDPKQDPKKPKTAAAGFHFAFADLNHDERTDIVTVVGPGLVALGPELGWLEQPADPSEPWLVHRIGTLYPDSTTGFSLADINGNGRLDVIAGSYSRGPRDQDGEVALGSPMGRLAWFEQADDPKDLFIRHDISRRKRGMFDEFVAIDLDQDGDVDFVGTRGNSEPWDGVFWLEQVRTKEPVPSFKRAREKDSEEVPLPPLKSPALNGN